jgi:branched-chain amino acid transport system ATP-binding protein/branched-chain amino acid transport system permease protein
VARRRTATLALCDVRLAFGGVRAIDGLSLDLHAGEVHGLIGPNGSGKTTTLNVIGGFARPQAGSVMLGTAALPQGAPTARARHGIARTFQTPRIVGEATVLDNVMIGGSVTMRAGFMEAALRLPRQLREERELVRRARLALGCVGLDALAAVRCDRLQHSELRFLEIARALLAAADFLLLDEPAAGLAAAEIRELGALIRALAARGIGVLLVEHHADLIFAVCDRVTVLDLGRVLAAGTPAEIRAHREVVSAYLGA